MSRAEHLTGREQPKERGAVLVLSAITLVILLLFSAVAVDLGLLMTERRQDQNSADVAVLAAIPERYRPNVMAQTILDSLNSNLGANTFVLADLNSCGTTEALPTTGVWTRYTNFNCIAHNRSYTELWLRVPVQETETVFGGLGGITSFEHSAFAQAGDAPISANILPYALASSASEYGCLQFGAVNGLASCRGGTSGNYGPVTFGLWGNAAMGTTQSCGGNTAELFEINLAQGIDHGLSRWNQLPHGATQVIDTVSCGTTPAPNAMGTDTGNNKKKAAYDALIGDGVYLYPDGNQSRLRRIGPYGYMSASNATINGISVEDVPLWDFIPSGLTDIPNSCQPAVFAAGRDPMPAILPDASPTFVRAHLAASNQQDRLIKIMERCLVHIQGLNWDDFGALTDGSGVAAVDSPAGCTGACSPIFTRNSSIEAEERFDIQYAARFGYVPQIASYPNGFSNVNILSFKPIYLHRLFGKSGNNRYYFDAGFDNVFPNFGDEVLAVASFNIPGIALPGELGDEDAPNKYGSVKFMRLTR
nr:hypothetical protein [uncultured bacterium]